MDREEKLIVIGIVLFVISFGSVAYVGFLKPILEFEHPEYGFMTVQGEVTNSSVIINTSGVGFGSIDYICVEFNNDTIVKIRPTQKLYDFTVNSKMVVQLHNIKNWGSPDIWFVDSIIKIP